MKSFKSPYLIDFLKLGAPDVGYISVTEGASTYVPFEIKRAFWTYYTPESVVRGRHAHKATEQVLIAVSGIILVTVENANGKTEIFKLDRPSLGLYIPPHFWHTMQFSHNAVQMVFASTLYREDDYLRTKEAFLNYWGQR